MSKLTERFIEDNKGQEITKHEGNFSLLVWGTAPYLIYSPLFSKYYNEDFGTLALLTGKQKGVGFFNLQNYYKSTVSTLDKYLLNKEKFTEIEDYEKINSEIDNIYNQYTLSKINELNDDEIKGVILKSFEILRDLQVITLFCEALDENIIKKYFNSLSNGSIDFKTFFANSTIIDFKTFLTLQDEALVDTNSDISKSQWLYSSYLGTPELSECVSLNTKIINERGGLIKIKESLEVNIIEINKNKKASDDFRCLLSGKLLDLLDFIKVSVSLRDVRKISTYKAISVLSNLVREFCERNGISVSQYNYILFEDFLNGSYKNKDYTELLKKREEGFLVYYGENSVLTEYVDFDQAKINLFKVVDGLVNNIQDIKGNVGCRGITTGTVKIVLSHSDFGKFNDGDILVTSMTRPEFIPLMKQSSAIITDEGGITCHAAIVSRELNRPCVIGTKKATRILKDGDIVEVDADKGIIRILK
jgi:phosphoenolpyruvate synthase/pyruvate phosphate dikinase